MPVYKLTSYEQALAEQNNPTPEGQEPQPVLPQEKTTIAKIDGPLSELFTKALQQVYSSENLQEYMAPKVAEQLFGTDENEAKLYVYSADGDRMTTSQRTEAMNNLKISLDSGKKTVFVANTKKITTGLEVLLDYCDAAGVRVYYNTTAGASAVMAMIGTI